MADITDVLIIGGGPGGLTAALTVVRQVQTCIVFDSGVYRNDPAKDMHMVMTWDGKHPAAFRASAREELLKNYDTARVEDVEVKSLQKIDAGLFEATDANGKIWKGKKVVLATGVEDLFPDLQGYAECWGKGIYHCFFCKGFEDRDAASSGILATGALAKAGVAMHVGRHALPLSKSVTFYTNGSSDLGAQIASMFGTASQMRVDNRAIKKLAKGPRKAEVIISFEDGSEITEGFLGHAPMTKARGPFVEQLGLEAMPNGDIHTSAPFPQTNVTGVFAAGDAAGPMKMVLNAQFQGSLAASGVSSQLIADEYQQKAMF